MFQVSVSVPGVPPPLAVASVVQLPGFANLNVPGHRGRGDATTRAARLGALDVMVDLTVAGLPRIGSAGLNVAVPAALAHVGVAGVVAPAIAAGASAKSGNASAAMLAAVRMDLRMNCPFRFRRGTRRAAQTSQPARCAGRILAQVGRSSRPAPLTPHDSNTLFNWRQLGAR